MSGLRHHTDVPLSLSAGFRLKQPTENKVDGGLTKTVKFWVIKPETTSWKYLKCSVDVIASSAFYITWINILHSQMVKIDMCSFQELISLEMFILTC